MSTICGRENPGESGTRIHPQALPGSAASLGPDLRAVSNGDFLWSNTLIQSASRISPLLILFYFSAVFIITIISWFPRDTCDESEHQRRYYVLVLVLCGERAEGNECNLIERNNPLSISPFNNLSINGDDWLSRAGQQLRPLTKTQKDPESGPKPRPSSRNGPFQAPHCSHAATAPNNRRTTCLIGKTMQEPFSPSDQR